MSMHRQLKCAFLCAPLQPRCAGGASEATII
jgi:hypothetical protein